LTGAGSALLGKEGAMACTVAVEESISEHYNSQIRTLMEKDPEKYTELLQVGQILKTVSFILYTQRNCRIVMRLLLKI